MVDNGYGTPKDCSDMDEATESRERALYKANRQLAAVNAKNAELKAVVEKLSGLEDVETAIKRVQTSIKTYREWGAYCNAGGRDYTYAGNLEHHEQCLVEYAQVMYVFNSTHEAAEEARETKL